MLFFPVLNILTVSKILKSQLQFRSSIDMKTEFPNIRCVSLFSTLLGPAIGLEPESIVWRLVEYKWVLLAVYVPEKNQIIIPFWRLNILSDS